MAKKVSKMAIRILPIIEAGEIIFYIYGEKALMKIEADESLTKDDMTILHLKTDDMSTLWLNDEKVMSVDKKHIIISQQ